MRIKSVGKKLAVITQVLFLAFGFGAFSLVSASVMSGTALAATGTGGTGTGGSTNQAQCGGFDPTNPLESGAQCGQANGTSSNLFAQGGVFQTIANTLIFIVGAVAVIFLIIGGLRYVISNGDSKNVEAAKNTILYAIVGIVVAVISFALVQFVITALGKSS